MEFREPKLLFDAADYELVRAVDEAVAGYRARGGRPPEFAQDLHPRGIRELAEPRAVRMTRTMLRLLERTGFTYCGKVVYRSGERLAFEKRL